jgi:4'-phosphopantetheinyl transferase EntD
MLVALAGAFPLVHWDRLLFSAKETIYMARYQLTGRHARVVIDPSGTFTGKFLIDGARRDGEPRLTVMPGRFLLARDLVATAVTMPATDKMMRIV